MSLKKYARPKRSQLTKQYTVRLSERDAELFESYCRDLNLTPAEAFRFLVLEELESEGLASTNQVGSENIPLDAKTDSPKILNDVKKTPRRTVKKSSRAKNEESEFLAKFRIEGQLPCPICNSWSSAGHFRGRHAAKHGFSSTYEFLKAHEEDVKQMHKTKIELP